MDAQQFEKEIVKVVALYSAGVEDGSFESLMDDLSITVDDDQWDQITKVLEEVDLLLAYTDKATDYQKAKAAGIQTPSVFERGGEAFSFDDYPNLKDEWLAKQNRRHDHGFDL